MIEYYLVAASSFARDIDMVFDVVFWSVAFWFTLTFGAFIWLIFKFRAKEGVPAQYITGEEKSQKKYISYPHFAVLIFDVLIIVMAVRVWYDVKQDLPPADHTVRVIGQQWAWTFVHPGPDGKIDTADDITEIDELHLQVDSTYHYKLESTDVLHSFSIPVFRLKQDAIPGRVITGWFKPILTGEWDFQCAEICGIGHGIMAARVFVETPAEHEAWMQQAMNQQPGQQSELQLAANAATVGE